MSDTILYHTPSGFIHSDSASLSGLDNNKIFILLLVLDLIVFTYNHDFGYYLLVVTLLYKVIFNE